MFYCFSPSRQKFVLLGVWEVQHHQLPSYFVFGTEFINIKFPFEYRFPLIVGTCFDGKKTNLCWNKISKTIIEFLCVISKYRILYIEGYYMVFFGWLLTQALKGEESLSNQTYNIWLFDIQICVWPFAFLYPSDLVDYMHEHIPLSFKWFFFFFFWGGGGVSNISFKCYQK